MGYVITKPWGLSKPPVGWQANPRAIDDLGIIGAWLGNEGAGLLLADLSPSGNIGALSDAAQWGGIDGLQMSSGSSYRADMGVVVAEDGLTNATLVTSVSYASPHIAVGSGLGLGNRFNFLWLSDGNVYFQIENGSGSFPTVALPALPLFNTVGMTFDGSLAASARVVPYINGLPRSLSGSTANQPTALATSKNFYWGWDGSNGYSGGKVAWSVLCNKTLTPEQMLRFHVDPFWWIQAPSNRAYFLSAGGSNTYNVSVSETASATDAVSVVAVYVATVSEAASATDTPSAVATYVATVSEAAVATDTPSAVATYAAALTEAATATDTYSTGSIFTVSVSEAAVATDTISAAAVYPATISEAAVALDNPTAGAVFAASLVELAAATDVLTAVATYTTTISETAVATETVSAGTPLTPAVLYYTLTWRKAMTFALTMQ